MDTNSHYLKNYIDSDIGNILTNLSVYSKCTNEVSIFFSNPKVVQKSYGQEKRFFCPPPQIHITNSRTRYTAKCYIIKCNHDYTFASDSLKSINSYISQSYNGQIYSHSMDEKLEFMQTKGLAIQTLKFEEDDTCSFKAIHFNDERQKTIKVVIEVLRSDNTKFGIFISDPIKVISKPSKKKNSTYRNTDMLVKSDSFVSFFSRARTHTYSTKYMNVSKEGFICTTSRWSSLKIYLVENELKESSYVYSKDGYISYDNVVKIVDQISGISFPRLVIYKVESYQVISQPNEIVSQLHKVALKLKDSENSFLCVEDDKVQVRRITKNGKGDLELPELACWSIVSTSSNVWNFIESKRISDPVTPLPYIIKIEETVSFCVSLEISGYNFSPDLIIYLNEISCETTVRDMTSISCIIPDYIVNCGLSMVGNRYQIFLLKNNGMIFPTGLCYFYGMGSPGLAKGR